MTKYRAVWIKDGHVQAMGTWLSRRRDAVSEGNLYPHFSFVEDENGNVWYND